MREEESLSLAPRVQHDPANALRCRRGNDMIEQSGTQSASLPVGCDVESVQQQTL